MSRMPPPSFPSALTGEPTDPNASIRATDNDAALARLSAVQKRYLGDPYIAALVPRAHLQPPRPPLINIGTYLRGHGIDELVDGWIDIAAKSGKQVQIVSLGAGSDTRFWRLATGKKAGSIAKYIELDFQENTMKKAMAVRKSKILNPVLGEAGNVKISDGGATLHSPVYSLLSVDLRSPPEETIKSLLASEHDPLLSPTLPTLLLFECVLAYMTPDASNGLIHWFVDYVKEGALGAIVYEMFGLEDAFGRVMMSNLRSRNVTLPGVAPYPTFASLPQRFLRLGFSAARALTLREIRLRYIEADEQDRIAGLEMLDEIEELELVLDHYAITWGVNIPRGESANSAQGWKDWGLRLKPRGEEDED
ncbi:leucine carboxyl methyltransferase [Amylostereum chailletii]|nr:leucine carboxyl methyltransferase [Amylostereum chailletii]